MATIHLAYDLMKECDRALTNMEKDFILALSTGKIDAWATYKNRLEDILKNHEKVEQLIKSYLYGPPIDVFNLSLQSK